MRYSLLFIFLLSSLAAQEVLHLDSAMERALCNSFARKNAGLEVEVKNAEAWQNSLYPNPELTVELDSFGGRHQNRGFDSSEISYSLSQLILMGGKRGARRELDEAVTNLAKWDFEIATEDLLNEVVHTFIGAYVVQEKLKLAREQQAVAQHTWECVQGKCQSGKATPLQEKKAALNLHSSKMRVDKAESALFAAKQQLASLWQEESPDFEQLSFPLYELAPPPSLQELESALANNPEIAKANAAVVAGLAATDFEEAMSVPDVEVEAGIETYRNFRDQDFFVSFTVPLPLFDRNQGNRARASFQSWQASYARHNQEMQIRKNLKIGYQGLLNAYNHAKAALDLEQAIASDTLKTAEESFKQGKIERQEWLDTKKTWLDTKEQTLDAAAEYQMKKADIFRLTAQRIQDAK